MAQSTATRALKIAPQVHTPIKLPSKLPPKDRYIEVDIGDKQVRMLVQLIKCDGLTAMSEVIGVSPLTLLRVACGMYDRCLPATQLAVRRFFATGGE